MMQVGDQVQFGMSTFLTVQFINQDEITCAWLENNVPRTVTLNSQCLTPVEPFVPEEPQGAPFGQFVDFQ
jgi:hypothetical protein